MIEFKNSPKVENDIKLKELFCFLAEDRSTRELHLLVTGVVNLEGDIAVVDLSNQPQINDIWKEDDTVSDFCEEYNLAFIKGYDDDRTFKITFEEM